jgi:hypothetical protein
MTATGSARWRCLPWAIGLRCCADTGRDGELCREAEGRDEAKADKGGRDGGGDDWTEPKGDGDREGRPAMGEVALGLLEGDKGGGLLVGEA